VFKSQLCPFPSASSNVQFEGIPLSKPSLNIITGVSGVSQVKLTLLPFTVALSSAIGRQLSSPTTTFT